VRSRDRPRRRPDHHALLSRAARLLRHCGSVPDARLAVYVFMLLLGISSGFTSTLLGALWPEVYGGSNLGRIRAIIVSAMGLSSGLGPGLTGELIDLGILLPTQMIWMAIWCLAASVAMEIAVRSTRNRESLYQTSH
jgi:MFS family permease